MSALLPIINHLIQQNPEHQCRLAGFSGKSLSIQIAGLRIRGQISETGFLERFENEPDAEITFLNSAVQKILQGSRPGVGDITIEGDLVFGMSVLPVLAGLRYYANDDLSRIFGDAAAGSIATRAAFIGHTVKQIGASIAEQIGEFAREPESPVVDQATLAGWMEEVDQLRDDLARLHARLDRLERKLPA